MSLSMTMPLPVSVHGPRLLAHAVESLLRSSTELSPSEAEGARVAVLIGDEWREGLERVKGLKVGLVLVASGTPEELQSASKEGIHAFIHADDGVIELSRAIGAAAQQDDYCSHTLLPALLEALRRGGNENGHSTANGHDQLLSVRELEVAGLAAEGLSNGEIAGRLSLSVATVKFHLASAYRKTGARGRAELRGYLSEAAL